MKTQTILFSILTAFLHIQTLFAAPQRQEHKLYTSKNSSEVILKFNHWVEIQSLSTPSQEMSKEQIDKQLAHLFGPMGVSTYPGVPKGDHKLRIYKPKSINNSTYRISYNYTGTAVVKNGPSKFYEITLPNNPDEIYSNANVGKKNPCTDEHYQSEGDFWYFWNPNQLGCKLKEGKDYVRLQATITRKPNQSLSFPEYARLVRKNSDGKQEISIYVFIGMDDPSNNKNPYQSKDLNADTFFNLHQHFLESEYALLADENLAHHPALSRLRRPPQGYLEKFQKEVPNKNGQIKMTVFLYFGPTGISESSKTFHYLFKEAIENGSVMIYDGHSGLGGHLDIESIESAERFQIRFNQNQYQIFYFNSCSSYPYYNTMYFERKKSETDTNGTLNLDILTNGLATYFSVLDRSSLAVISAIEYWAMGKSTVSYQELAKYIDSGNLFGVNGDEDNPKTP